MDAFERFFRGLPPEAQSKVALCSRCSEPCSIGQKGNEEAKLLRFSDDPKAGLCANCAVRAWFEMTPLWEMVKDSPEKLLHPIVHQQFEKIMEAGNADMNPSEISWTLVVRHWNLPFPKQERKPKKYSVSGYAAALVQQHDFDHDIAWLCAHYWLQPEKERIPSPAEIYALMGRVKHIPTVPSDLADKMLGNYNTQRGQSSCT